MASPLDSILSLVGNAARALAPQIRGGGSLVNAGKSLADAFSTLKGENGGQAPAEAERAYVALFAKVQAHADSTLDRLEGNR